MSSTPGDTPASLINEAFASAVEHLHAGQPETAAELCHAILQLDARHPRANHMLGLLSMQGGHHAEAAHFLQTALMAASHEEQFWLHYMEALAAAGEIEAAKQILALSRTNGLQLRGAIVDRLAPPAPALRKLGKQPTDAEIKSLNDAFQRRDFGKLETLAQGIVKKYPDAIAGWKSLSLAYFNTNRPELALAPTEKLVELQPADAQAHANLGLILMTLHQLPEAAERLTHAISIDPNVADTHANLGNVRRDQGNLSDAARCYHTALAIEPTHSIALANLGVVLLEQGEFRASESALRASLEHAPNSVLTLGGLATALVKLGRLEEADQYLRRSVALDPNNIFAYDLMLFAFNYTHTGKSREARELAQNYDTAVRSKIGPRYTEWNCAPAPQRIKVGFVSGDFNNHPVGYFTENLLRHLDPARVEVIAYSSMPERKTDELTTRLRGLFSDWRAIHSLNYAAAAAQIHADGIHVLIDLSGHTTDNRLPVFAMKPAPVQASWLGYFATTGIAEMDWFVGDPWLCPPEEADDFTEKLWRLRTWLCFTPPDVDVPVAPLPALANGYINFGCFNNLNKMNDAVVALWAELLHRIPNAKLMLKAPQLHIAETHEETLARFAAHGIAADRLMLEGPSSRADYLAAYGKVDICLDPFPYPGGTTSVEALWMGVPVLTLRGDRFLSHLGESVAQAAGLPEWIAVDKTDYAAKAASFAADLPALAQLRAGLRERLRASPLLDAPGFAHDFENMLYGMWEQRNQAPMPSASSAPALPPATKPLSRKQPSAGEIEKLQQLFRKQRHAELEKHGQDIARKYPHAIAGWKALSLAQHALGKLDTALASTQRLLELLPGEASSHARLGEILVGLNRLPDAAEAFTHARALDPALVAAHIGLGYIHRQQGHLDEAAECYRRAIAIDGKNAAAHANLGVILLEKHDFRGAEASFRATLALDAKHATALLGLSSSLVNLGQLIEAETLARRLIARQPDNAPAWSTLLFTSNYNNTDNAGEALALARQYGAMLTRKTKHRYTNWTCDPAPGRLKVGLVSGDLYNHPVGYFLEGLLRELDKTRIEIVAYANRPDYRSDAMSAQLRAHCDGWKAIDALDDDAAAALIHADGIHVLLDLAGHTGNSRLPVFARKPAPVQAAWLGYFATTGVAEMDWLIGDPNVCPPGEEHHFTEKIWRLPDTYLCFTPPDADVAVGPLPSLANGYITFGCFNNVGKYTDAVIALWSRILGQIPNARLLLKAKQLSDADVRAQMQARFAAHGIGGDRLLLEGPSPRKDYLAAYNRIDIALDPFPYPGGTTSVEALWMGVPVLTLRGQRMLSHAGENIMTNLGLPEWIAADESDYAAKAVELAANPDKLAALRNGLRQRALASPMFDAPRFARHFEEALRGVWMAAQQGDIR